MMCATLLAALALADDDDLVLRARQATARYHDQRVAIADGYRQIGRDFPGMGEHWIHIGRVFDGRIDPERPEMLSYLGVDGVPRLTGVAYVLPLLDGESPPDFPVERHAWHSHVGTLDEETFTPHHHMAGHHDQGSRLAMVHAWIWLDNDDGLFAADNWAIPYVRLGLAPPPRAPAGAAKALSLASGGDDYFAAVVTAAGASTGDERAAVRDAFARARGSVERLLRGAGPALTAAEIRDLEAVWTGLWQSLDETVGPETRSRLRDLAIP